VNIAEKRIVKTFSGHQGPYDKIYFSIDGKYMVAQGRSETVFYQLDELKELLYIKSPMCITTTCNRLFNGLSLEGKYFEWSEKALAFLFEVYAKEEP